MSLPQDLSLFGTISDGELTRRIGLQTSTVFLKRSSVEIAPENLFVDPYTHPVDGLLDALVSTMERSFNKVFGSTDVACCLELECALLL
jgi:hypothetical protein